MHSSWYQVAFARDIAEGLTPLRIAEKAVLLRRRGENIVAFDGRCPHRGAALGHGGRLDEDSVICPFHGLRIGLGQCHTGDFAAVRQLKCLVVGGMVFVKPVDDLIGDGFCEFMLAQAEDYHVVPGFVMPIAVEPELVVENAFDSLHFKPVHGILNTPSMNGGMRPSGGFAASGVFELLSSPWQTITNGGASIAVPFEAIAFGPTVVVSTMGGPRPYRVYTAATPRGATCHVFLSVGVARDAKPSEDELQYLLRQMRMGLEQDREIWEHLLPVPGRLTHSGDEVVDQLRAYLQRFQPPAHD
jgi:3-ketosteroid 9alpha-monooxygenase subunit A